MRGATRIFEYLPPSERLEIFKTLIEDAISSAADELPANEKAAFISSLAPLVNLDPIPPDDGETTNTGGSVLTPIVLPESAFINDELTLTNENLVFFAGVFSATKILYLPAGKPYQYEIYFYCDSRATVRLIPSDGDVNLSNNSDEGTSYYFPQSEAVKFRKISASEWEEIIL